MRELTEIEVAVLSLVARGYRNAEIAVELHRAEDTIKTHIKNIFRALGARGRANAVAVAYSTGIFSLPERTIDHAIAARKALEGAE